MAFKIGPRCEIHPTAVINVKNGFIGSDSIVGEYAVIEGNDVQIGREAYIGRFAQIGGGSCFDSTAFLKAGNWLHMGTNSHINIARGVTIGNEFGFGIDSKIFTHGAYLDAYSLGAPIQWGSVEIGDNVWMPNAWVHPNIQVGSNTVIASKSLINKSIPGGVLAGGIPAKIIVDNYLPRKSTDHEKTLLMDQIMHQIENRPEVQHKKYKVIFNLENEALFLDFQNKFTKFYISKKIILGDANIVAVVVKDQLRRNGIRFKFSKVDDDWVEWDDLN
jgi:acetyltransferase-like isoleucine patch superfamily enzyme